MLASPTYLNQFNALINLRAVILSARVLYFPAVFCVFAATTSPAIAQSCESPIGKLFSVQGEILINKEAAVLGQVVCAEHEIVVAAESRAGILLTQTQTVVRVDQNTSMNFQATSANKTLIEMLRGILHLFTRKPSEFRIDAPYATAMVEGTEFVVSATQEQTGITVIEGQVRLRNTLNDSQQIIRQNFTGLASSAGDVSSRPNDNTRDSVYWAVHYPRLDDIADGNDALKRITQLLSKGRYEIANELLSSLLENNPDDEHALALQSTIAAAQGNSQLATTKAKAAIKIAPESSFGFAALSYANQAAYDLPAALKNALVAVENGTENLYALTRLAEVQISLGDFASATQSLELALKIDPQHSRAHTLMGFNRLNQRQVDRAVTNFATAIELDNSDPMPHLGLGLTLIKRNRIIEGRQNLEIAVSLDPLNSLLRSYLGKAYYEVEEPELADEQFSLAKILDTNDPTPWYYDAISLSSEQTPIQELQNLEKAIDLNDNRSVYRSRLALDSDLATRGVGLSRLYSKLGFNNRATTEAASSLILDPANHSAHRFLSDSYSSLSRHEVARVSELLQSQLLNPLNTDPISPSRSFAFTNNSLGRGSAIESGFNEYTSLFERNGPRLTAALEAGNQEFFNGDLVGSWVQNNFSLSAGTSRHSSDGYRANNDLTSRIHNIFSQWTPNNQWSFQAEYRNRSTQLGDLEQRFSQLVFSEDRRYNINTNIYRIGSKLSIDSGSTLLLSAMNSQINSDFSETFFFPESVVVNNKLDAQATQIEMQHLYTKDRFSLISGIGLVDQIRRNKRMETYPGEISSTSETASDGDEKILYLYYYNKVRDKLNVTLGLGFSQQDNEQGKPRLWQPKFGLVWKPSEIVTVRAAYFKSLNRFLVADQSIEPTQIAGFNQSYDNSSGTEFDRIGVALDLNPNRDTSFSVEATHENNAFVIEDIVDGRTETNVKLSASWSMTDNLVLGADVIAERYNNRQLPPDSFSDITQLETIKAPVKMRYFFNHSVYLNVTTLFLRQSLERATNFSLPSGNTDTILLDVGFGLSYANGRGSLSFAVSNVTNTPFRYQDDRFRNAQVDQPTELTPERQFTLKTSYRFN